MPQLTFLSRVDWKLFFPAAFLVLVSNLILKSIAPEVFPYQFIILTLAILAFFFFNNLDIKLLSQFSLWLYIFSFAVLLVTFLFGVTTRGSVRWLTLGPLTLQSSEAVKPLLLIFFADLASRAEKKKDWLKIILLFLPVLFFVLFQPDLGSSIVLVAGFLGIMFTAGVKFRYFLLLCFLTILALPLLWSLLAPYQKDRLTAYIAQNDPLGGGYNAVQAAIAIGSGGFWGRGLGQGSQGQLRFLPEKHTDFVFASLSEELGFSASFLVIIAYFFIFLRLIQVLARERDKFSAVLLGGIFLLLFTQTTINIGMNLGLLPITGIPLPFLSYGGSSLVAASSMLGIASGLSYTSSKYK